MALSFYSNYGALEHLNQDTDSFPQPQPQPQPELAMDFLGFQDSFLIPDPTTYESIILSETGYSNLFPYFSPTFDHNSSNFELFPPQELDFYPYPKRQKSYEDQYYSDLIAPGLLNGFVSNNPPMLPEFSPELHVPLPEFHSPLVYSCGSGVESIESVKKPNGGCLSAQTIAARQRRRKITEKTQELGKLIPGGQKMNTAEMFQAAFKYIKFLQAQVGVLGMMGSIQDNEEEPENSQELQELVTSPRIQEKLYSSEKCIVPNQLVQTLVNDNELQSNSLVLKELHQYIPISG
ncbi:Transcription factor bHLH53 [Camellia lanceoleosa]|uniref:Transcription factor bHLH53 n=1 Tax=Camellia lanceoleosa TaxID=1840588 RepID=A0ACC0GJQ5_9ERIC|nr:Transcription factor bHLH53 [Camellia lanceoleosa]